MLTKLLMLLSLPWPPQVTNNIAQVAYLNAQQHACERIYFIGNFLRHNELSCQRLSYAINFWSAGRMEALFLEHEGYFGALGAFLLSARDTGAAASPGSGGGAGCSGGGPGGSSGGGGSGGGGGSWDGEAVGK